MSEICIHRASRRLCYIGAASHEIYAKTISHLSKPLKYQRCSVPFTPNCAAPFLSHYLRYKILTQVCLKFHCIAQKDRSREIITTARFKFTLDAASWLVSFNLSPHFILSRNFKIYPNFRSLPALKAPLKFLRSHLAYARPDFAQTPLLRPHRGILR